MPHDPNPFASPRAPWRFAGHPFLLFLLLLLGHPGGGWASTSEKIDPRLAGTMQTSGIMPLRVIVSLADASAPLAKPQSPLEARQLRLRLPERLRTEAARNRAEVERWLRAKGVRDAHPLWIINSLALRASPELIRQLAALPQVVRIRPDEAVPLPRPVRTAPAPVTPASAIEWNIAAVKAPELWRRGVTGKGIVVASLDTGVDFRVGDLAARWRGGANSWFDPFGQHATPFDAHGHGTEVMGLMVGGSATGSAIGMAPGAQWIAAKIFDDTGGATISDIHKGFQWVLDPDGNPATDDAPDIVNNSWMISNKVGQYDPEFVPDVQALDAAGIAVVFCAGNAGPSTPTSVSPANYTGVLPVGSVGQDGSGFLIAGYSSRGPSANGGGIFPLLVAPGTMVRSCTPIKDANAPATALCIGTSFAAPHVSGGLALLKSAWPTATAEQIQTALMESATDLGEAGPDNDYGYGMLDLLRAYDRMQVKFGSRAAASSAWLYVE